ncbi:undecaprenyl-phosphate galactose phosphotransferase [Corallococcus coralloides DSM 2259]|uniref:Undecaprenyl-phosphate galactose phosphotransferase n=1 Tax=Corallococcus coralloides (strain ATCC 25202 / DSM 2259 / NBRC 100086 / M2) TaxID=1144275 RepID=H8MZC6_CORCM|nr:sugar transferase [Corallococcus coralloides]AFE08669.1 undecaprenyl-phosphate galactose phosphotransferase [Corallococcus coralloides DSM 2259]
MQRQAGTGLFLKRCIDVVAAGVGLLCLSPVMAATGLFVRLTMGGPVLFRQRRPGKNGQLFTVLKFRTMLDATDATGEPLPDEQRITWAGQLLRSTSLDELPQLWNVLRGDMSLVGPRPLLVEYLPRYSAEQARRHDVLPGITGWAQINGRNALSWEERFRQDVWYVEHWSLALDLKVLALTVVRVLQRQGISFGSEATMHKFMGTPQPEARVVALRQQEQAPLSPPSAAPVSGERLGPPPPPARAPGA